MSTISYSSARENLAATMDQVCDNHEPVVITRQKQRSVVILSLEDYKALEETSYLLRSPANARRELEKKSGRKVVTSKNYLALAQSVKRAKRVK